MTSEPVLFSVDGAVATITLNRPDHGNTIDMAMAQGLVEAAIRCDTDETIRCVKLTGNGKLFCGGGDVGGFAQAGTEVPAYLSALAGTLHMAVTRLARMAKPLLVLVNGPAAGAGMSLAIAGDVVIAAESAHFTTAYGAVGLTPDGGMSWLLPRLVGLRRAQRMLLTGERVSASEAEAIGLVSQLVADKDLATEGRRIAGLIVRSATGALGGAKALLLESSGVPLEAQLEREARSITAAGARAESREGVAAFLDGRKPNFEDIK